MTLRPKRSTASDQKVTDERKEVRATWPGRVLTRSTAIAVLIASYLAAVGVMIHFSKNLGLLSREPHFILVDPVFTCDSLFAYLVLVQSYGQRLFKIEGAVWL